MGRKLSQRNRPSSSPHSHTHNTKTRSPHMAEATRDNASNLPQQWTKSTHLYHSQQTEDWHLAPGQNHLSFHLKWKREEREREKGGC